MAEWTTVWVIVTQKRPAPDGFNQPYYNPYVWDAERKEWVHKGKALINAVHQGARFETKEKAEEAALILATEQPEFLGKLRVEPYKL